MPSTSLVRRALALITTAVLLTACGSGRTADDAAPSPAATGTTEQALPTPPAGPLQTADDGDCETEADDCAEDWDSDWDDDWDAAWEDDDWGSYWDEWDDYDWGDGWDDYCGDTLDGDTADEDEPADDDDLGGDWSDGWSDDSSGDCYEDESGEDDAETADGTADPGATTGRAATASGLRADAPDPTIAVIGTDDGEVDALVAAGLSDIFAFFDEVFPQTFDAEFEPPASLVSYDSTAHGTVCAEDTYEFENAFFDADCDVIAWDRGVLLPQMAEEVGPLAPVVIIAHEVGHDVQYLLGLPDDADVLVSEQQADCYAGAYWRWVVDGHSDYFAFDQADGMRQLMLGLLSVKDPQLSADELAEESEEDAADVHGSGFDRAFAGALGYTAGAGRCDQIDEKEMAARGQIQDALFHASSYEPGNLPITDATVQGIAATLDQFYRGTQPGYSSPALAMAQARQTPCGARTLTGPVVYCVDTNTVSYHLPALAAIGTPANEAAMGGDFSAFTLLASRYALAAARSAGSAVTGTQAGLAALCSTGTWARWMRSPRGEYQLSPWDVDKAIYHIIDSPLAGSDASGTSAAPIITRVSSFGYGITHTVSQCRAKYGS